MVPRPEPRPYEGDEKLGSDNGTFLVNAFYSRSSSFPDLEGLLLQQRGGARLLHNRRHRRRKEACLKTSSSFVSPTISLPLLVLIDMFAVSLVVPLLFQYYKTAGVTSAGQRELLSSLFSSAQIVGGLLMGVLTDAKLIQRRTLLFFSFGGSALSYALIVCGGLPALIVSRVLVGLVKQTMTVTTTMLTKHTTKANRAKYMGHLTASSTVAWIVGPSAGALLYKYVDHRAPALIACALFVLNMILAAILINKQDDDDDDDDDNESDDSSGEDSKREEKSCSQEQQQQQQRRGAVTTSILANLRSCFSSKALGSAVITTLISTWVTKSTNYSQLGSFYEDMYNLEAHHRGYISSYQQFLQFIVQSTLVAPVMAWSGGERQTTCLCTAIMAVAVFLESRQSLPLFLVILCPIISLCFAMSKLSLQTLVTHVAPTHSIFSVLAALDVLQNAVSVSVPFYRALLFRYLTPDTHLGAIMQGDPDPVSWIRSSALHWAVAAVAMSYLLLLRRDNNKVRWHDDETKPAKRKGR